MTGVSSSPVLQNDSAGEVLLIDKPIGWTSFDIVHRLRETLGVEKAGHAGTLDPLATGLLIVCTGRQTKRIDQFTNLEKEYTGTFELGMRTPSFDLETPASERADCSGIRTQDLELVAKRFEGHQLQTPPMYSAVKHRGKPLYKYARNGKTLERKAREIEVRTFTVLSYTPPVAEFRVVCSKGTYIRSLVNDIGVDLGCGAVLTSLRRTRIGTYSVEDAVTIEQLEEGCGERQVFQNEPNGNHIPV